MMNNIQKNGVQSLLFSILLVLYAFFSPIEMFLGSNFEGIFKILQYALIVVLLFQGSVLHGKLDLIDRKRAPLLPLLLLLLFSAISIIWARDISTGIGFIKSNGLRMLMIILAYQADIEERQIKQVLSSIMLGTCILAIMVARSSVTASMLTRTSLMYHGTAFDTNNLSGYLAIGFAILLNYKFKIKALNIIRYLGCGICVLAVLMTASRGGVVAIIAVVLFTGIMQKNIRNTFGYLFIIVIGSLVLIYGMHLAGVTYIDNVVERFLYDSNGSGADRVTVWGYALQLAMKSPILGYGIGSAFSVLHNNFSSNISTHNVYLTFLLDGGIVGLGLFITSLFRALFTIRMKYTDIIKPMIIASMSVSMFLDTYNKKILWLPLFFFALAYNVIPCEECALDAEKELIQR